MNYEWIGKTIWKKKSRHKNRKNGKNQSEISACEKKTSESEFLFKQEFLTLL